MSVQFMLAIFNRTFDTLQSLLTIIFQTEQIVLVDLMLLTFHTILIVDYNSRWITMDNSNMS